MIDISLYGGEVTLRFDEGSHAYFAKDRAMDEPLPVPGVTTVCGMKNKPALVPWAAKTCGDWLEANYERVRAVASEVKADEKKMIADLSKEMKAAHRNLTKKAADSGTIAHQWIERFIKGVDEAPPEDEAAQKAVGAFMKWWESHHVNVLASETIVFSRKHWYAGTMDLLAEIDGVLTLADFKTSSNIYADMAIQLGAYRLAWEEMGNPVPQEKLIINIQKNGNLQTAKFNNHGPDERAFLSCLEIYRWNRYTPRPATERIT